MPGESDITIEIVEESPIVLEIVDEQPIIIEIGESGPQGNDGLVTSVEAGDNITVDDTDPAHPIVSADDAPVQSVNGEVGDVVLGASDVGADPAGSAATAQSNAEDYTDLETARAIAAEATKVPTTRTVNGHALSADVTVTKSDVGLGNADNTSDANKPISTATQTALNAKQPLDTDLTTIAALNSATAGVMSTDGAGWIRKTYAQLKTALGLVKADVGLSNVDNTSDANKPISSATQTALNTKVESVEPGTNIEVDDSDPKHPVVGTDFKLTISDTEPVSPNTNDLWIDTSS